MINNSIADEVHFVHHPNISIERLRANMRAGDKMETSEESNNNSENDDSDDSLGPLIPHPNMNLLRDEEIRDRLNPKCCFISHPNVRLDRLEKYQKCFEDAEEEKKNCSPCKKQTSSYISKNPSDICKCKKAEQG